MNGHAIFLSDFVEGNKQRFIIPVYQRNYDWLIENCDQLFNDLVKLSNSDRPSHFFGSIVTSLADFSGYNRLVIDGQQRITTISLLLLAGIKAVNDGKLSVSDTSRIEEAKETFLLAKFCASERKIKLQPIENDIVAYDRIFNGEKCLIEDSKMTRNFGYFYEKLVADPNGFTFDDLLDAIKKLQIISISLDWHDDAQLIFESLNSTGLALSEADKIRNYLLMALSDEEQHTYYKTYWQQIEEATNNQPTMFIRDYLTIMQQLQRHVRLDNLYVEWKKYMADRDRKAEMKQMLIYANYYQQVTKCNLLRYSTSKKNLSEKMQHIGNLETDTANVFFIQFLKYAADHDLTDDDVYGVIDLIENYMARRIVCGLQANALTQVFCALHKDVVNSIAEYTSANVENTFTYAEILAYHILRREGKHEMPRDVVFGEAILTRDIYKILAPYRRFLFERLENAIPGEYIDVAQEMREGEATIEHIMPQKLTQEWKEMLGDNFEEVHERYLHTFANLTLTGINGELSNKPFAVKRDGTTKGSEKIAGYKDSKYRLTRDVMFSQKWTEEELKARGRKICDTFLTQLYPLPQTKFKPLPKPCDEITLDDETFVPTYRKLMGYRLFGKEYQESKWVDMLVQVVRELYYRYPDQMDTLFDVGMYLFTEKSPHKLGLCAPFDAHRNKYVYSCCDNKSKMVCLRYLFEKCDIAGSELVMLLEYANDKE